jgi:hypothetical protein
MGWFKLSRAAWMLTDEHALARAPGAQEEQVADRVHGADAGPAPALCTAWFNRVASHGQRWSRRGDLLSALCTKWFNCGASRGATLSDRVGGNYSMWAAHELVHA